jgi:hypothetical protein
MGMAMTLCASSAAMAQLLKPNAFPPPKDGLLLFEMLRPADEPDLFHSWRANLGYQYGGLESKLANQPERRDLNSETAGLNFRIGARSFGGIDLTLSDQTINLRALGLPTSGDLNEVGIRASGGTMLLPYLAVGGSLARNKLDGTYRFGPMPTDQASGVIVSSSAFAALLYPAGDWKLSLTGAYTYDEAGQSFADGFPREQKAWARTGTLVLAALHPIARQLDGVASLTWSHVIEQRTLLAGRRQDDDWLRPSAGLLYKLTDQTAVSLVFSMYLLNDVYDYESVSVGFSYKF